MFLGTFDARLAEILRKHNAALCPSCGHELGWGDIAWNEGCTEYGTPNSVVYIICSVCSRGIVRIESWSGLDNDDLEDDMHDLLFVLHNDWRESEWDNEEYEWEKDSIINVEEKRKRLQRNLELS